MTVGSERIT